ncbi:MAG TPA: Hpt domain-containing protein, partial [Thiobacillaceae bacterium]|nr:Hpt domain-containing protein [Thiobacillaceae bacterium]
MSDFAGMEELLQDFLLEAGELLSQVDNKLVELEKRPEDRELLNDIFRGFHTIKGGAGFLNVENLVNLCHRTENLFDKLRNGELHLSAELMDIIMAATATVRDMFGSLSQSVQPHAADASLINGLDLALAGNLPGPKAAAEPAPVPVAAPEPAPAAASPAPGGEDINWDALHAALTGAPIPQPAAAPVESPVAKQSEATPIQAAPPAPKPAPAQDLPTPSRSSSSNTGPTQNLQKETTIRIDTARLDQVLNLSGEIGLTKNRIANLKTQIIHGRNDQETLKALDTAVSQLDLLVS